MLPFYANFLGSEGYGILAMLELVTSALSVLVGYGIGSAVYRFYFLRDTEADKKTLVSTAIVILFLMTGFVSLPAMVLSGYIARWALGSDAMQMYVFLAIIAFSAHATSFNGQTYYFNSALFSFHPCLLLRCAGPLAQYIFYCHSTPGRFRCTLFSFHYCSRADYFLPRLCLESDRNTIQEIRCDRHPAIQPTPYTWLYSHVYSP